MKLVVIGPTGAGKSELLNAAVASDLLVDPAKPCTLETTLAFEGKAAGYTLSVFEMPGFSMVAEETDELIEELFELVEPDDVVWFCLNGMTYRIEEYQLSLIDRLVEYGAKVVLVLASSVGNQADAFAKMLRDSAIPVSFVAQVVAKPIELTSEYVIPATGVPDLVRSTLAML